MELGSNGFKSQVTLQQSVQYIGRDKMSSKQTQQNTYTCYCGTALPVTLPVFTVCYTDASIWRTCAEEREWQLDLLENA